MYAQVEREGENKNKHRRRDLKTQFGLHWQPIQQQPFLNMMIWNNMEQIHSCIHKKERVTRGIVGKKRKKEQWRGRLLNITGNVYFTYGWFLLHEMSW